MGAAFELLTEWLVPATIVLIVEAVSEQRLVSAVGVEVGGWTWFGLPDFDSTWLYCDL